MLQSFTTRLCRLFRQPRIKSRIRRPRIIPHLEALADRITPAVTASFDAAHGVLTVTGDELDNFIAINGTPAGDIVIQSGDGHGNWVDVPADGGVPTILNTTLMFAFGNGGDDFITIQRDDGPLPVASVLGGVGDDALYWADGSGTDYADGGTGKDQVLVLGSTAAADVLTISPYGIGVRVQRSNGDPFTVVVNATETVRVEGGGGDDSITASTGLAAVVDLILGGNNGNDTLVGGDGGDTLQGGDGHDLLVGGAGNDALYGEGAGGGTGNDVLIGGDGDDEVHGGHGGDVLTGGPGNDHLFGDADPDVFSWSDGDGDDVIEGGDGNDTLVATGAITAGDNISISPNGDRVHIVRNNLQLFTLNIGTTETLSLFGVGGNDTIAADTGLAGLVDFLYVSGGDGNDLITGGDGTDVIGGGAGNDVIHGGAGNDSLAGDDGNDTIYGDDGNDHLEGRNGNDHLYGGIGNDDLFGGAGNDFLDGEDDDDFLNGGTGNDQAVAGELMVNVP